MVLMIREYSAVKDLIGNLVANTIAEVYLFKNRAVIHCRLLENMAVAS